MIEIPSLQEPNDNAVNRSSSDQIQVLIYNAYTFNAAPSLPSRKTSNVLSAEGIQDHAVTVSVYKEHPVRVIALCTTQQSHVYRLSNQVRGEHR